MTDFLLGPDLMFVPADRPDRFEKAAARATAVILDLEDAVLPAARPAARAAVEASRLDPATTVVRLNAVDTPDFADDLACVRRTGYRHVMVAKSAFPASLRLVDGDENPYSVLALLETAAGVAQAEAIAALPHVSALMWGAEDLVVSTGGTASRFPGGAYRDLARYARSRTLVAAKAHGKAAIDAVFLDLADAAGLGAEARDAAASGFDAKAVLHPDQAALVRASFMPDEAGLAWARGVLEAADRHGAGAFALEGVMVDEVVVKRARALLRRAPDSQA